MYVKLGKKNKFNLNNYQFLPHNLKKQFNDEAIIPWRPHPVVID